MTSCRSAWRCGHSTVKWSTTPATAPVRACTGNRTTEHGAAFGCVGGVLFLHAHDGEYEHEFIENPAEMREDSRIGSVYGHHHVEHFFGKASYRDSQGFADDGIWLIDAAHGEMRQVFSEPSVSLAFSSDGEIFYVLGADGVLHALDAHDGDLIETAKLVEPGEAGRPAMIVVGEWLYLADPNSGHVLGVHLEHMEIEEEWHVGGAPSSLAFVGVLDRHAAPDAGHEDEHDHEEGEEHDEHEEDEEDEHGHEDDEHEEEGDAHGHHHHHGSEDPHFWFDADLASVAIEAISDELGHLSPDDSDVFGDRLALYLGEVEAADAEARALIEAVPAHQRLLVTFHDAFAYFAHRYGLEIAGFLIEGPEQGISAEAIAELIELIEHEGVETVFHEQQFDSSALDAVADETGAKRGIIWSQPTEDNPTYIGILLGETRERSPSSSRGRYGVPTPVLGAMIDRIIVPRPASAPGNFRIASMRTLTRPWKALARSVFAAGLLLAGLGLLVGCGGDPKILAIVYWQAPSVAGPYQSGGYKDRDAGAITLEPLAHYDPDGVLVPALAEEIPTRENGGLADDALSITWRLKDDLKWSDGSEMTADDVVFTWRYCIDEGTGCTAKDVFAGISAVEALDSRTVRISFEAATPYPYQAFVSAGSPIISRAQFAECIGEAARDCQEEHTVPLGTGPYRIVSFTPEVEVRYERNPHYRGEKPFFDRVVLTGGGDAEDAARALLERGEADYAWNLQVEPSLLADLEEMGHGTLVTAFADVVERVVLNQSNPDPSLGDDRSEYLDGTKSAPISDVPSDSPGDVDGDRSESHRSAVRVCRPAGVRPRRRTSALSIRR